MNKNTNFLLGFQIIFYIFISYSLCAWSFKRRCGHLGPFINNYIRVHIEKFRIKIEILLPMCKQKKAIPILTKSLL
jgi:hypothetical protein